MHSTDQQWGCICRVGSLDTIGGREGQANKTRFMLQNCYGVPATSCLHKALEGYSVNAAITELMASLQEKDLWGKPEHVRGICEGSQFMKRTFINP